MFISEIVHTEGSFLLKLYYKFNFATEPFFSMKRVSYSVETKYKAVEMKAAGFSTKEIMKELNIRNRTQVKTWW
uniref:Transposase n=1 Tax=Staphylococcus epidermidis TaxID=1282 RepID=A0A3G1RL34_STAEP|nr:transposase [Staphylococcus epidermidis]